MNRYVLIISTDGISFIEINNKAILPITNENLPKS